MEIILCTNFGTTLHMSSV